MKININLAVLALVVACSTFLGCFGAVMLATELIQNRIERAASRMVTELGADTPADPKAPFCDDPDVARYSAACPQYEGP